MNSFNRPNSNLLVRLSVVLFLIAASPLSLATIKTGTASFVSTSEDTSDFLGVPPFLEKATGKPSVILAFDVSGSMLHSAYERKVLYKNVYHSKISKRTDPGDAFDPARVDGYYGYFDPTLKYTYDYTNEFFYDDPSGTWNGSFLNWLTMRRVDVARKVMVGGKVHKRAGETINGKKLWILEGEKEYLSNDRMIMKFATSSSYSPIPDDTLVEIANGEIRVGGAPSETSTQSAINSKIEVGYFDATWTASQYKDPANWPQVSFLNSYSDPVFVAVSLSYHGGDPSVARAYDVTKTSARVGLIEWKTVPDDHTASDIIFYMVAEKGCHDISLSGGGTHSFCAGKANSHKRVNEISNTNRIKHITYPTAFTVKPSVFAGVSTYKPGDPFQNKVDNIDVPDLVAKTVASSSTELSLGLESSYNSGNAFTLDSHEQLNWIALENGVSTTASGVKFEVGNVGSVDSVGSGTIKSFSHTFADKPFVAAASQTSNDVTDPDYAPYFVRIGQEGASEGGTGWSNSQIEVSLQTHDDSTLLPNQTVSYIAVKGSKVPKVRLAVDAEPKGLVQYNEGRVNFGLTVYDFDHKTNNMSDIISKNVVHGGTMNPCYPIFEADRLADHKAADAGDADKNMEFETVVLNNGSEREYLCVPTGVHAPNEKIRQVIEEYPMLWGTTPIAETLVSVNQYVRQESTPIYNGGNMVSKNGTTYDVYDTGNGWDPYYDAEQGKALECKKVFLLNFNDGAPYKDFDGTHTSGRGSKYYTSITGDSKTGENEVLDSVALAMRQNDCRQGGTYDLPTHQEVISYYVFAALDGDQQNSSSMRRMMEAAARGGFVDGSTGTQNLPDPMWPKMTDGTEVKDFSEYAKKGAENCPENEWDGNGDCVPDTFYLAEDGDQISTALQSAINDMLDRISSGGAASVVSTTASGEGALYQASFSPSFSEGEDSVRWIGDIASLMIDSDGLARSDDGDGVLEETSVDLIYDSCYNEGAEKVYVKLSSKESQRPTAAQSALCSSSTFDKTLDDVGYLWSAKSALAELTNDEARLQRGSYSAKTKNRYIRTNLLVDENGTGSYEFKVKDFLPATFSSDVYGMLNVDNSTDAENVVNFIRGVDQSGLRSRELGGKTMRLGDIIYSTPVPVSRPSEGLHLLYDDPSYHDFFYQYRNRRTVVYVGGNDGMLHAFNGGWYDKTNKQFTKGAAGDWDLGQEIWGFVPYNLLPHLEYTSRADYGVKDGDHVNFVDQTPYVFDAKIFGSGGVTGQPDAGGVATHPNGWGTILVVGFRTGGGTAELYPDPTDTSRSVTVRPAYMIFDITDPEQEPKLLAEFTHPKLAMTTSVGTALTVKNTSNGVDWYLALGSGPSATANGQLQATSDQNAHLFMLNLKTMALESNFGSSGVLDIGETNSFIGDIVAIDHDLDVHTDAVYFGTTKAIHTNVDSVVDDWEGKLFRMRVEAGANAGSHRWKVDTLIDAKLPIVNRPQVSVDSNGNRWVHVGTGRFFSVDDTIDRTREKLIGFKEYRDTNGDFYMDDFSNNNFNSSLTTLSLSSLVDVSNSRVTEKTGSLNGTVTVTPSLSNDTVSALEQRQQQYQNGPNYEHGWVKELAAGQKAMGAGTLLGGIYSQSTFLPDQGACSTTGVSSLYALRFTTGTAWEKHVFDDSNPDVDTNDVLEKVSLGVTPSLSPGIHLGSGRQDGEATLINLNSDMSMTLNTEHNLEGTSSKETSWREM